MSDFIVPSSSRRGDITIAVATGGMSPALAHAIRIKLEETLDELYPELVRLACEVRDDLQLRNIHVNGEGWQEALDLEKLLPLIKRGERDRAREILFSSLVARQDERP